MDFGDRELRDAHSCLRENIQFQRRQTAKEARLAPKNGESAFSIENTLLLCKMVKLVPAILASDPTKFAEMLLAAEQFVDELHVDFMDGEFVEFASVAPQIMKTFRLSIPVEAHLMVKDPIAAMQALDETSVSRVIVHWETLDDVETMIASLGTHGFLVGVALKPETVLGVLAPLLARIDQVLIMAVPPGRRGASLLPGTLSKVRSLKRMWPLGAVSVDGGVNKDNIRLIAQTGASRIIAASGIWQSGGNPKDEYQALKRLMLQGRPD